MLRFAVCCLTLLLVATGCGLFADQRYEDALTQLKGRPIEDLVALIGPPSSHNSARYVWEYDEEIDHPGYWTRVPRTVNNYNRRGEIVGTRTYYEDEYRPPYTEKRHCTTTVYIDAHRRVQDFMFRGNYCGEWFEETSGPVSGKEW